MNVHARLAESVSAAVTAKAVSLFQTLVADGAALGWVSPPSSAEVAALLDSVVHDVAAGNAALAIVTDNDVLAGIGYWRRYTRPTLRRHADIEKIAVAPSAQGRGVGRALVSRLIDAARDAGIEMLTLDVRGDNHIATRLYESFGFSEYGRLADFVVVGDERYDSRMFALDLRPPH